MTKRYQKAIAANDIGPYCVSTSTDTLRFRFCSYTVDHLQLPAS